MNCKSVIREISDYIDGDLDVTAKEEIEKHLAHCEDCKIVINQTKLTVDIFCDSQPVELPAEVRSRLHDALRRQTQKPSS